MAEIHVRKGAGGAGSSVPTLAAAVALVKAGDAVTIHEGVYPERLTPPQGTTWQAAEGEAVVLDGGWGGKSAIAKGDKRPQVLINKPGVTVRGLVIRNVPGQGVAVAGGGDGFVMTDCTIHDCYDGGVGVNGTGSAVENVTFRRVTVRRVSRSWAVEDSPSNVNGCFLFRWAKNALVEDCVVSESYGEGMACGIQTVGITLRRVTIHTTMHLCVYASNRAQDVLLEDCVFYQTGDPEYLQGDGDVGAGIVIGDETRADEKDDNWRHAEDVTIRRCVVVNCGILLNVRNQLKPVAGAGKGQYEGYETRIQRLRVENCTFVAGPLTRVGIGIQENEVGHEMHGAVTGCVVILNRLAPGGVGFRSTAAGIEFDGNAFSIMPPGLAADNIHIDAAALIAPLAPLPPFAVGNYRPRAGNVVALGGLGALGPDGPEPPVEPPGDEVDWDALIAWAEATEASAKSAADGLAALLVTLREYRDAA